MRRDHEPVDPHRVEPSTVATTAPVEITGDRSFFGHPAGLRTLFTTEMWERFSYYGIRPLLVLFMTAALAQGGFGFDRREASAIVGIYAASVYLASLPGGWVADRLLGLRRAIWWGGIFIMIGHFAIALSAVFARPAFFLGLVFIVIGTGLLKPNISAIVGDLYPEGGSRRDAGFALFYMGINIGGTAGQFIAGYLGEDVGWHWGFGAAGIGMLIGLITFRLTAARTLGPIGVAPARHPDAVVQARQQRRMWGVVAGAMGLLALVSVLAILGVLVINPVRVAESMTAVILTISIAYFVYLLFFAGLTRPERKRVGVIIILAIAAMVFWAAFEQAPTSLNLFAADFTDRTVGGMEIPATWFQSANTIFVILLSPVFAWIWLRLGAADRDPSHPAKFAFGLFFAAIGFSLMILAANRVVDSGGLLKVSALWLVASYFFQTVGELCLSPVGLSSMTKLAPKKFSGQMMGVWFLATSLGNLIAGLVGGHVDPEKLDQMPQLFERTTLSLLVAAVLLALLVRPMKRLMAEGGRPDLGV